MARKARSYRSRWLLTVAVAASVTTQASVFALYEVTRPIPDPRLSLHFSGEGTGQILVTKVGDPAPLLRCSNVDPTIEELGYVDEATDASTVEVVSYVVDLIRRRKPKQRCELDLEPGTRVRLTAVLGKDATFGGYRQVPMRPPKELVPYLGDPLARCTGSALSDQTNEWANNDSDSVLDCTFTIEANTELAAEFGEIPDRAELAMLDDTASEDPEKTDVKKPLRPIDAEKLDDKPLQVAIAPLPKQLPPPIVPPPPKPPQQKQDKPKPPPPNMTMVEVHDDEHVVDKAPDDATKLSDKNRDVEKETRATETNLEKESKGKQVASKESDDRTSPEIGGPDDKIRQLEETDPTTDDRVRETDHSGDDNTAKGAIVGEGGDDGQQGTGQRPNNLLGMRGIEGRGKLTELGNGKKRGKRGAPGINSPLAFQDYERIMGKQKVDEERQVARRKMSAHKGRWERKLEAVRSSLENFIPDVQTGNQTALKTRAHPFALYIVRMHRRIHELWGFGFLEQLDDKPATYPLNNPDLWVNLEISLDPDGSVHKVTIAKTSGQTEFDVAAIDTVLSAAPYEPTPEKIRSVNGRVYMRWGFYRNWRQCGTFNVEPYILTSVPNDDDSTTDSDLVKNTAKLPSKLRRHVGGKTVTPNSGRSKQKASPSTSVTDRQAVFAANLWVSAFATASVDKLVKYSTVPFYAGGKLAAQTSGDLREMFGNLIVESGPLKDWKLLSPNEYRGGGGLPDGNVVLQVRTTKEAFAIVLTRTKSGEYRATQLAR